MAVRHIRSLMSASALRERGTPEKELASQLRMAPWQVRNITRQAAGFSDEELVAALKAAAEVEAKMKTSQGDPRLVFERWLLAICGGRARG
jgi:DNA polymerase III delta subunit